MIETRMDEAAIDARLDLYARAAGEGDTEQARHLHELFDFMLTERETEEGRLWLTDHGKMLLAGMHRDLGRCKTSGQGLADSVLQAVRLKPNPHHWDDTCSFMRDLRLAITVANEMCAQREAGDEPDLARAAEAVAEGGEFGSNPAQIREIYDDIASTVSGFREIAHC